MNRLLLAFLALSLVCNAWLAFGRSHAPRASAAASLAAGAAGADTPRTRSAPLAATGPGNSADHPAAIRPFVWKIAGDSDEALRALAGDLRAAGMPPEVVARVVGEMLRERLFADIARLPHWQLIAPSKENRRRQAEAARELLRLQEAIVGPDGAAVKTLDPTQRRLEYGDLRDTKVAALLRLERDYQELTADLIFGSGGPITQEEYGARQKAHENLQKERATDIAAALTPEEFADLERRKSPAAERLQRSLRDLTLTEESYLALLEVEKARDPYNNNFVGAIGNASPEKLVYLDKVRDTLGVEQANAYLKAADFSYGMAARATEKIPGMTAAKTYELYKLQSEAQSAMRSTAADGSRDVEKLRATMAEMNARLESLLGSAAAEAYRKSSGGMIFKSFPVAPASGTGAPPKG